MNHYRESLANHFNGLCERSVTGFKKIDFSGGLPKSKLIVISGKPQSGKTSLALSIAHNAMMNGSNIAVISKQMTREEIDCRFVSYESGVALYTVMYNPEPTKDEEQNIFDAMSRLEDKEILFFDDRNAFLNLCFYIQKGKNLNGVIVDSYQLFRSDYDLIFYLYEKAKREGFWIIVISDIEGYDKNLSEVNMDKALFNLADSVIYVSRSCDDVREVYSGDPYGKALIDVVKGRYSGTFSFVCNYNHLTTRFTDIDNVTFEPKDPLEGLKIDEDAPY